MSVSNSLQAALAADTRFAICALTVYRTGCGKIMIKEQLSNIFCWSILF